MRNSIGVLAALATLVAISISADAQGRGGRQGGPGSGQKVLRCLNPNMAVGMQITKGAPIAQQYGVDPNNGVIVMRPEGDAAQLIQPCANFSEDDPFAKYIYPPDQVMSHQEAIGLSDNQRSAVMSAVVGAQTSMATAQLRAAGEVEKLQQLLEAGSVNEAKVLEQLDRVLAVEREVKRAQITMMVRVKNNLTAAQQAQLDKLRLPRD